MSLKIFFRSILIAAFVICELYFVYVFLTVPLNTGSEDLDGIIIAFFGLFPLFFIAYFLRDWYRDTHPTYSGGYTAGIVGWGEKRQCAWCAGSGEWWANGSTRKCRSCNGMGAVAVPYPFEPCWKCQGTGRAHSRGRDYQCNECNGTGWESYDLVYE